VCLSVPIARSHPRFLQGIKTPVALNSQGNGTRKKVPERRGGVRREKGRSHRRLDRCPKIVGQGEEKKNTPPPKAPKRNDILSARRDLSSCSEKECSKTPPDGPTRSPISSKKGGLLNTYNLFSETRERLDREGKKKQQQLIGENREEKTAQSSLLEQKKRAEAFVFVHQEKRGGRVYPFPSLRQPLGVGGGLNRNLPQISRVREKKRSMFF